MEAEVRRLLGAYINYSQNSSLGRTCELLIGIRMGVGSSLILGSQRTTSCLALNLYDRRSSLGPLVLPTPRRAQARAPSHPPTGPPDPPLLPQENC